MGKVVTATLKSSGMSKCERFTAGSIRFGEFFVVKPLDDRRSLSNTGLGEIWCIQANRYNGTHRKVVRIMCKHAVNVDEDKERC